MLMLAVQGGAFARAVKSTGHRAQGFLGAPVFDGDPGSLT